MVKAMYLSVTDNGVDNREGLKDMLISYRKIFFSSISLFS